jgi:hypothetical protein
VLIFKVSLILTIMAATTFNRRSPNEVTIEELQKDAVIWDTMLQYNTEEIQFLLQFLEADIFKGEIPNLYENLTKYCQQLTEIKINKIKLHKDLHNHKNDLNGMMECEDISCDAFYQTEHIKLANRIEQYNERFRELKFQIYRFCTPLMKKT